MPNEGWREPTFSFSTLHFLNSARLMLQCNSDRVVFIQVKNRMLSAQHYQSTLVHSKSCFFFVRDTRCVWWMRYTVCVCVCARFAMLWSLCCVVLCVSVCAHKQHSPSSSTVQQHTQCYSIQSHRANWEVSIETVVATYSSVKFFFRSSLLLVVRSLDCPHSFCAFRKQKSRIASYRVVLVLVFVCSCPFS